MRLDLSVIGTAIIIMAVGNCAAWAQDLSPVRPVPGRPKPPVTAPAKPGAEADEATKAWQEAEAAKARQEAEAKAKAWDRRLKRTMGSICRGAPGC